VVGKTFGRLSVLSAKRENGQLICHCRCTCGNEKDVLYSNLKAGRTKSCGCLWEENRRKHGNILGRHYGDLVVVRETDEKYGKMVLWECRCRKCGELRMRTSKQLRSGDRIWCSKYPGKGRPRRCEDLTGRRYGRLTVLEKTTKRDYKGSVIWRCRCDCGNEAYYSADELIWGNNVSCGCRRKETLKEIKNKLHFVDGTCVEWLKHRKHRRDNTSGFRGVRKLHSGHYQAMIGMQNKRYALGSYRSYAEAVEARLEAEHQLHDGFVEAYERWKEKAESDPAWGEKNPFRFEVEQTENGFRTYIRNGL
jgi:hypothetical protein